MTTALEHLRALVAINSFTNNREGVLECGRYCEEQLFAPLGFAAERIAPDVATHGDHLFLERPGPAPVILVGHLDTVYPREQESADDFEWRERDGRIHGPGVADIKGGIVAIWMALRALRDESPALFENNGFKVFLNASEEGGCADFPVLARERVPADARAALVFEPGMEHEEGTSIVVARKGCGRFRMDVAGREAHSGNDHPRGANAIRELARRVEQIESLTDYERDITLTVGTIEGGTAVNCVPGHATCQIDLRIWTPEDYRWGRERLMALAGEGSVVSGDGSARTQVSVSDLPGYPPWPDNPETRRLSDLIVEAGASLGQALVPTQRRGGSDGAHLYDVVPTVDGLGPVGRNSHCSTNDPATGREQESIDRDSLEERARLGTEVMRRLLST
jgi:glutamate carboxypeptidase